MPRLGGFLETHPDVAVTVESRSRPFSFAEENFDLAIHFGQPVWAGGTPTYLCTETVLPVAGKALAGRLRVDSPADLLATPLLHLTTRPKLWAEWLKFRGGPEDNAYHGVRFDQFAMIIAAAMAGLGVALLPTYLVEAELQSGALVAILDAPLATQNAYYSVRPETRRENQMVDLFDSWLLSQIG